jgi:regulatory protein
VGTSAYQRALRRLARRDHSEAEMRGALQNAGYAEEDVEATLARLRAERLLDDASFASRFAASRIRHQGLGRHRVRQTLRQKGVTKTVAEAGIVEALAEVSEAGALDALARRYWRQRTREEPERRLRKLWVFLLRRGFPGSLVAARLKALWPRHQDALEGLEPLDADALDTQDEP